MNQEKKSLKLVAELSGVDEAIKKVERYVELLEKAKTLADELASIEFEIKTRDYQGL